MVQYHPDNALTRWRKWCHKSWSDEGPVHRRLGGAVDVTEADVVSRLKKVCCPKVREGSA